jgi:hypothetical protein
MSSDGRDKSIEGMVVAGDGSVAALEQYLRSVFS